MKVYIPAEVLKDNWTGVQYYTAQLIDHVSRCADVQLTVSCRADAALQIEQLTDGRVRCQTDRRDVRGSDIIHFPTVYFPWCGRPRGSKVVMTFHDLVPLTMPKTHLRRYRLYFRWVLPFVARWLDGVVAVSDSTSWDVQRFYHVPPERIAVTGQGCRYEGQSLPVAAAERDRVVLAVGTLEPRKNLRRVIEAFLSLEDSTVRLVIAGGRGWGDDADETWLREDQGRIEWLDYVESDELSHLYRRAAMLVYPSLYEGFGLPVLEAMTLGCPVITSNVSSLPQVAGDAAAQVDPDNVKAIADAMRRLLGNEVLRAEMAEKGVQQAATFTWQQCAQKTVALYHQLLEG